VIGTLQKHGFSAGLVPSILHSEHLHSPPLLLLLLLLLGT
jgi:hypothetical protein